MNTDMAEALAAVGQEKLDQVTSGNKPKVPNGKFVIAVELWRDDKMSGRYLTQLTGDWAPIGMAAALKGGAVVAANYIFGSWAKQRPYIRSCRVVVCPKCGERVAGPAATWQAKDLARQGGIDDKALTGVPGIRIIEKYGKCPRCGGRMSYDVKTERADLSAFADKAFRAIEAMSEVPKYLAPTPFTIRKEKADVDLGPDWRWINEKFRAATAAGELSYDLTAHEYHRGDPGSVWLFNPGFWIGYADKIDGDLFFPEDGRRSGASRASGERITPANIRGL